MLERIKTPNKDIIAFEAIGKITQDDYINKINPAFEEASRTKQRIRFLFFLGPRFEGFTTGAAWQDFKMGLNYTRLLDQCAVVSDIDWLRGMGSMLGAFMPFTVQSFKNKDLGAAMAWLNSGTIGLDYQFDSQKGLLKLEIDSPITSSTFEKLSQVVDPYIEKNKMLNGLVLHLKEFPGWEDFGSFIKHVQFVKNHHQNIRRVAFSGGGQIARLIPPLAQHFVNAEIKQFDYNSLDEAEAWAAG